jgi:hypothetical protein
MYKPQTTWVQITSASPALTMLGFIMAADILLCTAGLVVDRRIITGAPAWLKPLKFAVSTMIAAWSFAFCVASLRIWPRVRKSIDLTLTIALLIEIVLIDMQAARGTSSHFNYSTLFDGMVFGIMAVSIAILWLAMLLLTIVLFRQSFGGSAWGWSLRLGMVLALIGTGSGSLMTMPSPEQLAQQRTTGQLAIVGRHTVGAPDGGKGLPVTGWSADHGDLRIAHFIGMHGLQVLPFFAWWLGRRSRILEGTRRNLVVTAAASYLALFGLVLWQAFRGQSIAQPDTVTLQTFAAWLALSAITMIAIYSTRIPSTVRKEGI